MKSPSAKKSGNCFPAVVANSACIVTRKCFLKKDSSAVLAPEELTNHRILGRKRMEGLNYPKWLRLGESENNLEHKLRAFSSIKRFGPADVPDSF